MSKSHNMNRGQILILEVQAIVRYVTIAGHYHEWELIAFFTLGHKTDSRGWYSSKIGQTPVKGTFAFKVITRLKALKKTPSSTSSFAWEYL
ncbi:hypothetical protein OSB04_019471 [Centaurea solstitialis]|uniref:Uncharacterized protein n=1 Tax=Centaurea solstitialis TaxID=347529 RepID=A0AA38SQY5_9ASTR|nr:hypothetical protein OSB04_019471 [Centaurea solstitialis]